MPGPTLARAPVAPNASQVRGRLLRIIPEPEGTGSIWEIDVQEARNVEHLPNFVSDYVGKRIGVYVHPQLASNIAASDALQLRVAFRGDENGGRFVLLNDDVQKL